MAKKQLKKLNQPKKYLQGGSNMGSVSMMRQNPYFIGQVNQDAAEENLANMQEQVMQNKQTAAQAKKDARDMQNQQLDQTIRNNTSNIIKGAATDQKAGNLGKFLIKSAPTTIGNTNPFAFMQAPTQAIGTGTAIEGVGVLAPQYMPAAQAGLGTAVDAGVGVLAPEFIAPAADAGSTVANVGSTTTGLSSLATAGIGAAGMIGGQIIQKRADDNSDYTFTDKERRGNVGGSALSSAGTGFSTGAMIGSIVPGIGNVVGGAIGAGIGAGIGALKARKENKAAEEEAQRLQREQAAMRGAFQGAFVNSRLTGADTGFGLNASKNMNNQFTNQYQVAKTGGVKKVPGGKIVPIQGTDAVEFKGRSHENGGVTIDKNTEVEGGETMDQVAMNDNNKQDYIFSKYLKLGGKSFAQRHKEILKGSGSQAEIQQLAAMQEKVAGRDSKQVAAYGGFHKYLEGGVKPCPECPPNTVCNPATGECVVDEETSNSYDWNATGLEGFKAGQNAATSAPSKPAGKQISQADYDFYIREKNARLANEQRQTATQNGTSNAPADATAKVTYPPFGDVTKNFNESQEAVGKDNYEKYGIYKPPRSQGNMYGNRTKTGKEALEAGMARSAEDDKLRAEKEAAATTTPTATVNPGVQPPANTAASITDMASLDAAYNANKITLGEYIAKRKEFEAAAPPAASNTQPPAQPTLADDIDKMWSDKGYVKNADGDWVLPEESQQPAASGTATYTTPTGVVPPSGTQTPANTSNVQGGVGATTTTDKLIGSKTSGFLPTFENAKENPLWTKENYPAWKSEVQSAIGDADRQQKIVDYLSNYKGDYSAEVQKRIKGKTGQDLLTTIEKLATDNKPGIFHEAVRQALEATKPPAVVPPEPPAPPATTEPPTQELPKKYEPCPPGTYRSGDGSCKPVGDVPQASRISGALMAGLGQLIPVGAALANPYKIASGIMGTAAAKGALLPRVNMNQERASNIQQNVAYKNAVINQNAGPGALAAMQMANTKTNEQMLKIAQQEQSQNRQLAGDEAKLGMQASMFNVETDQKRQMFNKEFNQGERRYRREDILGALDNAAARVAGIFKDDRSYKAQERLATALDETGSYDRFSILEQLNKDAKRKGSPYFGTTEAERRRIAAAMHKQLNPDGYVAMTEYNKLQEEKAKLEKEKEEAAKKNQAKFGGARQYVSRLGELKGVRATKAKL